LVKFGFLTLFPWLTRGGEEGVDPAPYGKSILEFLSPILFYTLFTYTYIDNLNPRGQACSFKILKIRATQSLAANLNNSVKFDQHVVLFALNANFLNRAPVL
jgi:hypothetical protein